MTKLSFIVFLLGSPLFLLDFSYGMGWVIGWIFIGLLETNREKLLNKVINFDDFSVRKYIIYLLGVVVWIASPLLLSFFFSDYINPIAIFGAYFANRIIMYITKVFTKGER